MTREQWWIHEAQMGDQTLRFELEAIKKDVAQLRHRVGIFTQDELQAMAWASACNKLCGKLASFIK